MNISEYIRNYRVEHKLSQRAFAEICGVSNGYISLIEREEIDKRTGKPLKPKIDSLMAIAKGMGMTLQELIDAVDVDIPVDLGPIKEKAPTLVIEDERTVEFLNLFSQLSEAEQNIVLGRANRHSPEPLNYKARRRKNQGGKTMTYEIEFTRDTARAKFMEIMESFDRSEQCFKSGDLPRNIRNACAYSEAVRSLKIFGADVDASGIYDDNGFDRIGYGRINSHEFIKNGKFNYVELKKALEEIADEQ